MRIIAGTHRGRRLNTPKGSDTRPTSDRMRESIFNILENKLEDGFTGIAVADIFAGTGAMGLEAISRGAGHAVFIEKHSLDLVRENIEIVGAGDIATAMAADARNLPVLDGTFDVIFLDPPYGRALGEPAILSALQMGWMNNDTLIVIEMARDDIFDCPDEFTIIDERSTGVTRVLYLKKEIDNDLTDLAVIGIL